MKRAILSACLIAKTLFAWEYNAIDKTLTLSTSGRQSGAGWSLAGNDTVTLQEIKDWRFSGNFTLGTPGVTGSYLVLNDNVNSYVLSPACVGISRPAFYNPADSLTYV